MDTSLLQKKTYAVWQIDLPGEYASMPTYKPETFNIGVPHELTLTDLAKIYPTAIKIQRSSYEYKVWVEPTAN